MLDYITFMKQIVVEFTYNVILRRFVPCQWPSQYNHIPSLPRRAISHMGVFMLSHKSPI